MPWFLTEIFVFWNTFWWVHVQFLHSVENGNFRMVGISRSKRDDQTDSIFWCRLNSGHMMDEFWSLSQNTFSHFFVRNWEQVLRFIGFIDNHINGFLLWMADQFESSTLKIMFIIRTSYWWNVQSYWMWPKKNSSWFQKSIEFFFWSTIKLSRDKTSGSELKVT